MNKRIIFAGGTDWSVEFLDLLCKEGFNIIGVLAPPDSRKNRGQKINVSPLKLVAGKLKIPVFQPEKLNNKKFLTEFRRVRPDIVIVVAYGKLFPKVILAIPRLGFINFHPSLLPKLRGPSPIQSAILGGFKETGVSIIKLGEGMDDGPILAQEKIKIDSRETAETLTRKLINIGKKLLLKSIKLYLEGETIPDPQPVTGITYCKIIKKEAGKINWQKESAEIIDRKVRALNPGVKVFTCLERGKVISRVNVLVTEGVLGGKNSIKLDPGQYQLFAKNNKKYLAVSTRKGILLISRLQVEGKKLTSAEDFFQGYKEGKFSS